MAARLRQIAAIGHQIGIDTSARPKSEPERHHADGAAARDHAEGSPANRARDPRGISGCTCRAGCPSRWPGRTTRRKDSPTPLAMHALDRVAPPAALDRGNDSMYSGSPANALPRPARCVASMPSLAGKSQRRDVGQERHGETHQLAASSRSNSSESRQGGARLGEKGEALIRALGGRACGALLRQLPAAPRRGAWPARASRYKSTNTLTFVRRISGTIGETMIVDRAERIPFADAHLVAVVGGDENDRNVRRSCPAADQRRRLEAVQSRHVDVEQDDGEIALAAPAAAPPRRSSPRRGSARARRESTGRRRACPAGRRRRGCSPCLRRSRDASPSASADFAESAGDDSRVPAQRDSHARSTPIISSVSTGFDR